MVFLRVKGSSLSIEITIQVSNMKDIKNLYLDKLNIDLNLIFFYLYKSEMQ